MKVGLAKKAVKYGAIKGASIYLLYVLNENKNMTKRNSEKKETQLQNPFTEKFLPSWEEWKAFKKEQFNFTYKPIGEQAAICYLFQLSAGDEGVAKLIIERSKANGWKGFFEHPINFNGKTTQRFAQKPTPTGNVAPGGFGQF